MGNNDIWFPNLDIYLENVPKSFSVFGFEIAFYGLIIGVGVFAGLFMAVHEAKRTGQDSDIYWDLFIYAVLFSVIGARIYYVIFSWDSYKNNLLSILNLRTGGLAIYGAVIGATITLFIYAKRKKLNPFLLMDTGVLGLILGQIIGRWGNFTNREAFGQYTDNLFAMRLPIVAVRSHEISESIAEHVIEGSNYIQVHPTFLYECLWNIGILVIMILYRKHKKFNGEIVLLYLGGYGLGRIWIEGLRTDQLLFAGTHLAVSQMLAILLIIASVVIDLTIRYKIAKGQLVNENLKLVESIKTGDAK